MRSIPGGFLGGGNMLRSLTLSPMQSMLQEAHRMARRHLESGGTASSAKTRISQDVSSEFLLPQGIDPFQVALAIAIRLNGSNAPTAGLGNDGLMALASTPNGAVVVRPEYVTRLGGGDAGRGRRVLDQIVAGVREQHRRSLDPLQAS